MEGGIQPHPLLRGRRRQDPNTHGFSPSMLSSLSSICEALVPPLPMEDAAGKEDLLDKSVQAFSSASGSAQPVLDEVPELLQQRSLQDGLAMVKVVLWLMSFRLGTLLICRSSCLTSKFPFVRRFSEVEVEEREGVLQRWSGTRSLLPLRVVFVLVKVFCLFTFLSMTDNNSENIAWKAMGYETEKAWQIEQDDDDRHLEKAVMESTAPALPDDAALLKALTQKGLKLTPDPAGGDAYSIDCDVVVVGSDGGRGVAAVVLAGAGHTVVVVEKGDYFAPKDYWLIKDTTNFPFIWFLPYPSNQTHL